MQMPTKKVSWFFSLGELKKCFSVPIIQNLLHFPKYNQLQENFALIDAKLWIVKRFAYFSKGH